MSESLHTIPEVQDLIDRALAEDMAFHDVTTKILIAPDSKGVGIIQANAAGVLAGVEIALAVFHRLDPSLTTLPLTADGHIVEPGQQLARVEGSVAGILKAERTALNLLQRMSGVATETSRYVEAVAGLKSKIRDTRKTVAGWRILDKYAVRVGGGHNHRMNLADGILIKDNHIAALRAQGLTLGDIVRLALGRAAHTLKIEVEVTTLEEAQEALDAGAHVIMLDNMGIEEMRRVVQKVNGRALVEASGGVTLQTVRAVAETGVDLISVGSLTHSPRALDISLDLEA